MARAPFQRDPVSAHALGSVSLTPGAARELEAPVEHCVEDGSGVAGGRGDVEASCPSR